MAHFIYDILTNMYKLNGSIYFKMQKHQMKNGKASTINRGWLYMQKSKMHIILLGDFYYILTEAAFLRR